MWNSDRFTYKHSLEVFYEQAALWTLQGLPRKLGSHTRAHRRWWFDGGCAEWMYRGQQEWRRHMGPLPQVHGEPQSMHEKRVRGALTSQWQACCILLTASGGRSAEKPAEPRVLSEKGLALEVAAGSPWRETAGRREEGGWVCSPQWLPCLVLCRDRRGPSVSFPGNLEEWSGRCLSCSTVNHRVNC